MTVPEESAKLPINEQGNTAVTTVISQFPPIQAWTEGTMPAVHGESISAGAAVFGRSKSSDGVHGESSAIGSSGVTGINDSAGGHGIYGKSSNGEAGWFDGHVTLNGDAEIKGTLKVDKDITFAGGDCAEQFDSMGGVAIEPGTLLVIDASGALKESGSAYDKKVIGVVAGAGHYRPALVLDKGPSDSPRVVVSLMGKAFCKVDASYGAISVGDLLTSSPEPGHAMVAESRERSFGTVVGKALSAWPSGKGMIPILLALH
jgi:hypothetical protein